MYYNLIIILCLDIRRRTVTDIDASHVHRVADDSWCNKDPDNDPNQLQNINQIRTAAAARVGIIFRASRLFIVINHINLKDVAGGRAGIGCVPSQLDSETRFWNMQVWGSIETCVMTQGRPPVASVLNSICHGSRTVVEKELNRLRRGIHLWLRKKPNVVFRSIGNRNHSSFVTKRNEAAADWMSRLRTEHGFESRNERWCHGWSESRWCHGWSGC